RRCPALPLVDHIRGRSLKKPEQRRPDGFLQLRVIERLDHVTHPGVPFLLSDLEAQVRFTQAQPPSLLRVLAGATQKLDQERGESLDGAAEGRSREERPEQRILLHEGIKLSSETAASGRAADGLIQSGHRRSRRLPLPSSGGPAGP